MKIVPRNLMKIFHTAAVRYVSVLLLIATSNLPEIYDTSNFYSVTVLPMQHSVVAFVSFSIKETRFNCVKYMV